MPPIADTTEKVVTDLINEHNIVIFSKTTCPFCRKAKELFDSLSESYETLELNESESGPEIQDYLLKLTGQRTVPFIFIRQTFIGGYTEASAAFDTGRLRKILSPSLDTNLIQTVITDSSEQKAAPNTGYDYNLVVIGGGSGGLAAAKEAATLGARVLVADFVKPTPIGSTWGLGGTCVNVGCIPKKLMHQAALLGEAIKDARDFGWNIEDKVSHDWGKMIGAIQDHIGGLNFGYRVELRELGITYENAYAQFEDEHTIKLTKKNGKVKKVTGANFLLASGGRPRYPDIPNVRQLCITSDDLFSLASPPGKTLVVGASYIALECAGFLTALGYPVTILVRSILLRGFDQSMAEGIGKYMADHGATFIRPALVKQVESVEEDGKKRIKVSFTETATNTDSTDIFDTVLFAIGRDPCSQEIGLTDIGVELNPKNQKVIAVNEQTNVKHIFAVGDIIDGGLELTPVAIQAGKLLMKRLFGGATQRMDYRNVATTVFTPIEYGCIGLSEADAIASFGSSNIEVYHSYIWPLEWTVPHREENSCYVKLVCLKSDNERVIGFHVLGPNSGEITQGFAVAIHMGATKADFDATVGIHPTVSENLTKLTVTKSSGAILKTGGC